MFVLKEMATFSLCCKDSCGHSLQIS